MTCIVGIEKHDKVYMGCDSMAASGWDARITDLKKVFINRQYIIGYTTSFRMGQVLQYAELPTFERGEYERHLHNTLRFMVTEFVPFVREIFFNAGFSKIESNRDEGGEFLVGLDGFLFRISSDYQVNHYTQAYDAVGCGASYALGALAVLSLDDPEQAIMQAMEVSELFSNGVARPFIVRTWR